MADDPTLGFVGLGVMGEPMCRNLAKKSGRTVVGHDVRVEPLGRLGRHGVEGVETLEKAIERADILFLSLPGGEQLEAVIEGPGGILERGRRGQIVVDHSTAPVELTRELAGKLKDKRIDYLDAPVARTRQAAQDGTLAIMVGGKKTTFQKVRRYLKCVGTDITYCGGVGNGQAVKLLNNMVLVETVAALADALAIGRRAGIDGEVLFQALSKGSADSFALRNHGLKSLLPGEYPEQAFSTAYALKDLRYALELARDVRIDARLAKEAERILRKTIEAGLGDNYFPALLEVIEDVGE